VPRGFSAGCNQLAGQRRALARLDEDLHHRAIPIGGEDAEVLAELDRLLGFAGRVPVATSP
jgi:hypothetical protein